MPEKIYHKTTKEKVKERKEMERIQHQQGLKVNSESSKNVCPHEIRNFCNNQRRHEYTYYAYLKCIDMDILVYKFMHLFT